MDNTLLPCPFNCGGEISDLELYKEFPDSMCVRCCYCGAQGESVGTADYAREVWNRRLAK